MFFLLHNDLKSVEVARILRPIRPTSPTWLAATATPRRRAYGFRKARRAKRCEAFILRAKGADGLQLLLEKPAVVVNIGKAIASHGV
jgi:hypothetical protein